MTQKNFTLIVKEVFNRFLKDFFNYDAQNPIEIVEEKDGHFDNVIFISLFGNIEGAFLLEIDNPTAEKMLGIIALSTQKNLKLSELVKGYIGEFGNILASRVISNLGKDFGDTFLSTPSLFCGTGMMVDLFYDKNYITDLLTDFGLIKVSFSVKS